MKKIGFIGAYDKSNFIIYIAKVLEELGYKVLVLDTTALQKIRYVIPAINPTKSYITNFEEIDFGVGFDSWDEVEKYLGIKFYTNDEEIKKDTKPMYDYILIDVDSSQKLEDFEIEKAEKVFFVTSFDMFSLKKGIRAFDGLKHMIDVTKVLFAYETYKEDEEYLDFISLEYKIKWTEYALYFKILGADNKVFEDNQRIEKIKFRRLSPNYKESLAYIVQEITKAVSLGKIKKVLKD